MFQFYLHDIFGYVGDVQFVREVTADLTDRAMLGEQLHGFRTQPQAEIYETRQNWSSIPTVEQEKYA